MEHRAPTEVLSLIFCRSTFDSNIINKEMQLLANYHLEFRSKTSTSSDTSDYFKYQPFFANARSKARIYRVVGLGATLSAALEIISLLLKELLF